MERAAPSPFAIAFSIRAGDRPCVPSSLLRHGQALGLAACFAQRLRAKVALCPGGFQIITVRDLALLSENSMFPLPRLGALVHRFAGQLISTLWARQASSTPVVAVLLSLVLHPSLYLRCCLARLRAHSTPPRRRDGLLFAFPHLDPAAPRFAAAQVHARPAPPRADPLAGHARHDQYVASFVSAARRPHELTFAPCHSLHR